MAKNGNIIPIYGKKWQRFLPFSVDSLCWRQTDFRYHFIAIRYHMLPYTAFQFSTNTLRIYYNIIYFQVDFVRISIRRRYADAKMKQYFLMFARAHPKSNKNGVGLRLQIQSKWKNYQEY